MSSTNLKEFERKALSTTSSSLEILFNARDPWDRAAGAQLVYSTVYNTVFVSCYNVVSCSRYFYVAHGTGLEMMLHGALVSSSMFSIWTAILSFLFWVQCRIHTQVTTMSAGQTFGELALLQKWWTQHENILSLSCHCAHFADARRRLMKSHFSGWMYMQLYAHPAHPACDMYMYIYTTRGNHIHNM